MTRPEPLSPPPRSRARRRPVNPPLHHRANRVHHRPAHPVIQAAVPTAAPQFRLGSRSSDSGSRRGNDSSGGQRDRSGDSNRGSRGDSGNRAGSDRRTGTDGIPCDVVATVTAVTIAVIGQSLIRRIERNPPITLLVKRARESHGRRWQTGAVIATKIRIVMAAVVAIEEVTVGVIGIATATRIEITITTVTNIAIEITMAGHPHGYYTCDRYGHRIYDVTDFYFYTEDYDAGNYGGYLYSFRRL